MEAYLYTSSLREFLRFKRLFIWVLIAFAGMGVAAIWPYLSSQATLAQQYTTVSQIFVFHVLALVSAIYTTAIVSQEVEQKTIVYLLTRPVSRWKLLITRYLASATVVALLGILGVLLVSFGIYKGGALSNEFLTKDILAMIVGAFAYGALFLVVSLLVNRAMLVSLLFAFGWEGIVPNMPGEMYRLSVYSHVLSISEHPSSSSQGNAVGFATGNLSTNAISSSSAIVTLTVMTVALVALGCLWFTRFEFVPREDAE
jgi:ABC-2 type transport system permease protein